MPGPPKQHLTPYVTPDGKSLVAVETMQTDDGKEAKFIDVQGGRLWWTGLHFVPNIEQARWKNCE